MVMEDSSYPNAQLVGREFVRQYYTLLNEAPKYLHRFYSTNSSFIHGGVEKPGQEAQPVVGQQEIHKKILELNFSDCHAKIRQVDSQSTVGAAVVVQVTGELSNNGGPLRRFMQTFVLAPQNPKQYYVHNDIFRYQDEVFQDSYVSEEENEIQHDEAGDHENGLSPSGDEFEHEQEHLQESLESAEPVVEEPAIVNHAPVVAAAQAVKPAPAKQILTSPNSRPASSEQDVKKPEQPVLENTANEKLEHMTDKPTKPAAKDDTAADSSKNFSWANVVNKQSVGPSPVSVAPVVNAVTPSAQATSITSVPVSATSPQQQPMEESMTSLNEENTNQPAQSRKSNRSGGDSRRPPRRTEEYGERRNERFPDCQQVFVGNLPHDIAEFQLRKFFSSYGKVIECRINRGQPGNKVPFGFVVFETEEPVKQLLSLKRVEMDGHRLNVEEKKARSERTSSSGRDRPSRGFRQNRTGSHNKDRENSDPRPENRQGQPSQSKTGTGNTFQRRPPQ